MNKNRDVNQLRQKTASFKQEVEKITGNSHNL